MYLVGGRHVRGRPRQRRRHRPSLELVLRRGRDRHASSTCSCCSPTRPATDADVQVHLPAAERRDDRAAATRCRPTAGARSTSQFEDAAAGRHRGLDHAIASTQRQSRSWPNARCGGRTGRAGPRRTTAAGATTTGTKWAVGRRRGRPACRRTPRRSSWSPTPRRSPPRVRVTLLFETGAADHAGLHGRGQQPVQRADPDRPRCRDAPGSCACRGARGSAR